MSDNSSNLNSEAGEIIGEVNLSMPEENGTIIKGEIIKGEIIKGEIIKGEIIKGEIIKGEIQNKTAITGSKAKAKVMPGFISINLILTLFLVFCFFKRRLFK